MNSRRERFVHALRGRPRVLPSMLLCDFGHLEAEVRRLEVAGAAALHLDVMDGAFVPNFTYGLPIVKAFRDLTQLPLDVHLMMHGPESYLPQFVEAGADHLTVHLEAVADLAGTLSTIRGLGVSAGVALNLGTSPERLVEARGLCDMVLAMSVRTGFGGQRLDRRAFATLARARELLGEEVLLEVDGGVNAETVGDCVDAGAQVLVAGAAIFKTPDYTVALGALESMAARRP